MAGSDKDQQRRRDKRPKATLDLKADEIKSDVDETAEEVSEAGPVKTSVDTGDVNGEKMEDNIEEPSHKGRSERSKVGAFLSYVLAAVFGGAIALGGSQFMPRLVTNADEINKEQLRLEIAQLEKSIKQLKTTGQQDILSKLSSLEKRLGQIGPIDEKVESRLKGVEKTINDLALAAEGGDNQIASVAAIASRVNGIEERVAAKLSALESGREKLVEDTKLVAKTIAAQETLSQLEVLRLKTSTLGQRVAGIEAKSLTSVEQVASDVKRVQQQIQVLEEKGLTQQMLSGELKPLKEKLAQVTKQLKQIAAREAEAHETARQSALALAFTNLKRSLDQGLPFAQDLKAVKQLSKANVDFSQLERLQNEGVETEKALLSSFPALAVEALKKAGEQNTDRSNWDKLLNKAKATFKYRQTGDVKGDDSEAILARMEYKFKQGHNEDVLTEFQKLSGIEAQVLTPWVEKLKIRLMIETEMHRLEDQLLQSLSPR